MEQKPRKSLPQWLVFAILLLTILGSVYLGWWYLSGGTSTHAQTVIAEGPAPADPRAFWRGNRGGGGGGATNFGFRGDGVVHYMDQSTVSARKGGYTVRGQYERDRSRPWRISIDFLEARSWLTPEQIQVEDTLRRAGDRGGRNDSLNLTSEQRRQIAALPSRVELTPDERARFEALLKKWYSASEAERPAIADPLEKAVQETGDRHLAAAKALTASRAAEIAKILTPEQYKQAKQPAPSMFGRMFGSGGGGGRPTTRPQR